MKILVVCQYYYPENFQITPICEGLVKDGYDVTVLTGLPNYPIGVVPEEYKKGHRNELINGVKVIRVYERGRNKGAICLALNYASFVVSAIRKIRSIKNHYDLVFCYQLSPITMAIPAKRIAKKNDIPFMLYCCDLWPESLKMYIKSEKNPLYIWVRNLSKKIYKAADRVIVSSTSFTEYLRKIHGIEEEKIRYIPAFADETYLAGNYDPEGDQTDFVFLGNLGIAQDLFSVLKAVEQLRDLKTFKVHFVGDGSCLEEMKKYVEEHALGQYVCFYGRRPVDEMPKYYKIADACLVSLKADNATGLTLPSKVQGYMAAGKTIIGMINGSAKEVIEESKCGICVEAGNIEGLAKAMRSFITDRSKYTDCGRNAREYFIKNFRKDSFMSRLEDNFESMRVVD